MQQFHKSFELSVHGDIRRLEKQAKIDELQKRVHGDIRRLEIIKRKAQEHKNEIDIRVFNALMNYQVEVTD